MYDVGRRVWVKDVERLGEILSGIWVGGRVLYMVRFIDGGGNPTHGFTLRRAKFLRAADKCCDNCNRWLPIGSFNQGYRGEIDVCFLCRHSEYNYYGPRVKGWVLDTPRIDYDEVDVEYEKAQAVWGEQGRGGL